MTTPDASDDPRHVSGAPDASDVVAATPPGDGGPSASPEEPDPTDEHRRMAAEITLRAERIAFLSDELRAVRRGLKDTQKELTRARADLASLRGRRLVRLSLGTAARLRALTRMTTRARPDATGRSHAPGRGTTDGSVSLPATPAAFRAAFLDRLPSEGRTVADPLRIGVVLPPATEAGAAAHDLVGAGLADALVAAGWRLADPASFVGPSPRTDPLPDLVISAWDGSDIRELADGTVAIAWVAGDVERWLARPWFDEFDVILVPTEELRAIVRDRSVHLATVVGEGTTGAGPLASDVVGRLGDRLAAWAEAPRIDVAIGPPDWATVDRWGDYHFGRALQRALQRRGHPTRIRLRSAWDGPAAGRADIAIHLFGLARRRTYPEQVSILWIISHPELVTDEMLADYEPVFVASDRFAGELAQRTGRSVWPLHQATDPERFRPVPGGPAHDLLFVANSRHVRRPITDELTPTVRDLAVFGHGWTPDLLDPRHLLGDHVENARLAAYYAAAKIVLNDHWSDMAEHGFISNRLYDAAASGAFVISDRVAGIDAEFDGGVVTFRDGPELRELVDRFLADADGRAERARRAQARVLAAHTFDRRADEILRVIDRSSPAGEHRARTAP